MIRLTGKVFGWGIIGCLLGTITARGLLVADEPSQTTAPHTALAVGADPFRVPESRSAQELQQFVENVSKLAGPVDTSRDDFERRRLAAIRAACQRIRNIDGSPGSAAGKFARRKLAELDVNILAGTAAPAERTALAKRIGEYFDSAPWAAEDLPLAAAYTNTLEQLQMNDDARTAYTRYGKRLAAGDTEEHKQFGELMAGAARRLDCVGKPMELAGDTATGDKLDVARLRGKTVVVVYWSFDDMSLLELSYLRRLYTDFRSKGLEIVGASGIPDRPTLDAFLTQRPQPWPTLHDANSAVPSAVRQYGIRTYPSTFLVDKEGKVVAVNLHGRDLRRQVIKLLGPAMPRPIVGPEHLTSINEMEDRIIDLGEQWLESGKTKINPDWLGNPVPAAVPGRWQAAHKQPVSDEELYKQSLKSVFVVGEMLRTPDHPHWRASVSTAFVVTADGLLCTSAHVFDFSGLEVGALMAFNAAGEAFPIEQVVAMDPVADMCLFRIRAAGLTPLPLAERTPVGGRVRVISHPGASVYHLSSGHVTAYQADEQGVPWMAISAEYGEGSSGAPVFDQFGNVAGQVSQTSTLFSSPHQGPGQPQPTRRPPSTRRIAPLWPRVRNHPPAAPQPAPVTEPQMVFRYCVPAESLGRLLGK
jgi:peroxiredoxin